MLPKQAHHQLRNTRSSRFPTPPEQPLRRLREPSTAFAIMYYSTNLSAKVKEKNTNKEKFCLWHKNPPHYAIMLPEALAPRAVLENTEKRSAVRKWHGGIVPARGTPDP